MFRRFNFPLENVINLKIEVKKQISPPETHAHMMCMFHEVRTFTFPGYLFTFTRPKFFRMA